MKNQAKLTKREKEVVDLIKCGKTNNEIANELQVSVNTVKTHVSHILMKHAARSRIELIVQN